MYNDERTQEQVISDLESRMSKAYEKISILEAENTKLRYEFELLKRKWLEIEKELVGFRKDLNERK